MTKLHVSAVSVGMFCDRAGFVMSVQTQRIQYVYTT